MKKEYKINLGPKVIIIIINVGEKDFERESDKKIIIPSSPLFLTRVLQSFPPLSLSLW
jgi:hypothetical protein